MAKGSSKHTTGELIRKVLKAGAKKVGQVGSHWQFEHDALPGRKLPISHAGTAKQKGKAASLPVEKNVNKFLADIEQATK